jgi:diguanylate cyclase (GGDEF)-like protein/PAS domain S-box-containing protein
MPFDPAEPFGHNAEMLNLLTRHLPDMLWVKDLNGHYLYVNQAVCDGLLMAHDVDEPIGKNDIFFAKREREAHKEQPEWHTFGELCFNSDQVVIDHKKPMRFEEYGNVKGELLYLEVYKAPFYDSTGKIIGTVGAGRDITQLKLTQLDLEASLKLQKEQKEQLAFQATHDVLTQLPNRILFTDRLSHAIQKAKREHGRLAVLFMDLDNFKEINDSLGHSTGDSVLIEVARRMGTVMRSSDTLSRFGGDEFCIVLEGVHEAFEIEKVIDKYRSALHDPFVIDNNFFHVAFSIGVAIYPDDGTDVHGLLSHADAAMYRAKQSGRNTFRFYDEEMTKLAYERVFVESELNKAIEEDHLVLYYQPQLDATADRIVGAEVLVRWLHPKLGVIPPDRFIPIAEQNGMIIELDRVIMEKAFMQYVVWKARGIAPESISLNLSMKQIEEDDFLDFVTDLTARRGMAYSDIEFEVTETQIMHEPELTIQKLQQLHDLGISIAIDDFGTGYSSLAYLKRLPIHKLKIDKSFIDGLPEDNEDVAISKTVITLASSLNMQVIAEGVETDAQKNFLIDNGCAMIQGYWFSRPLPAAELEALLLQSCAKA